MMTREIAMASRSMAPLSEVVDFLDHKRRPVKEAERKAGEFPYYGANGQQGTIDHYLFDEPLVLMAEDGGFFDQPDRGIAYQISGKTWVNNHAHVLRPKNASLNIKYLFRVLQNYDVTPYISGSTRSKLTKGQAEKIVIPLPPLDEQRRIAAILDKADALRRKRKRALDLLDGLAAATFRSVFGDISKWNDVRPLAELADVNSGITKGRKVDDTPTRSVAYMAVSNVQDKRLDLSSIKTIEATEGEITRYRLKKDDLLLTEGGDPDKLGRGTLWRNDISEAIHQNHIFRVRIQSSDLLPTYLNWLVGSPYGKAYFLRSAKQTTGIASINKQQLSALPVPVPSLVSQHAFAQALREHEILSEKASRSGAEVSTLFASLQHLAFSGQL